MNTRLSVLWHWMRSGFWFVPSLMFGFTILLSFILLQIDDSLQGSDRLRRWWIYGGSLEGARLILSTIAASMATIAGVVFSVTIVVLSLASSQFGPRMIWNFMHDIRNQVVLGTFTSTFLYSILILGRIHGSDGDISVPQVCITFGIVLGIGNLGVLIFFIHHISSSIHANSVAASVWRDLQGSIARIFPEGIGYEESPVSRKEGNLVPQSSDLPAREVRAEQSGYLEAVNPDGLLRTAEEHDLLLRLEFRPGRFVVRGSTLLRAWPKERVDEKVIGRLRRCFILGSQRTLEQDVEFTIDQLVEIAVRSLSPGINDPFTAISCIDWLGVGLSELAEREISSPYYLHEQSGKVRVIIPRTTFSGCMDAAFNLIRQYSRRSPAVTIRLLESFAVIAAHVRNSEDASTVKKHALMVKRNSEEGQDEFDRKDIDERYSLVSAILDGRTIE